MATTNLPPAAARLSKVDETTRGDWRGVYGSEGNHVIGGESQYPLYALVSAEGKTDFTFAGVSTDQSALLQPDGGSRVAACWFSATNFSVDLQLTDGATHRVAIYFWDVGGARSQTVSILDAARGIVLDRQSVTNFGRGKYFVWDMTGHVRVEVANSGGPNALLNGLFFGEVPIADAPVITPAGGSFTNSAMVSLSATPDAEIRYTLDESDPDANSLRYTGPFVLTNSTLVKARAYAAGTNSTVVSAVFDLGLPAAAATFLAPDIATQGNWTGRYGREGEYAVGGAPAFPSFARVLPRGETLYVGATVSTNVAALQKAFCPDERMVGLWYSETDFSVDIALLDGQPHRVAAYFWDLDGGRTQAVEVLDAWSEAILHRRDVSNFENGIYLGWDLVGHVKIRITRTGGANAIINGIFFDPVAAAPVVSITRFDDKVLISWPTVPGGSVLEAAETLSSPFVEIDRPSTTSVSVPIGSQTGFFRLNWPR